MPANRVRSVTGFGRDVSESILAIDFPERFHGGVAPAHDVLFPDP